MPYPALICPPQILHVRGASGPGCCRLQASASGARGVPVGLRVGCTVGRLLRLRRVLDVAPALAVTAAASPSAGDLHSLTLRMDVQDVQVGPDPAHRA